MATAQSGAAGRMATREVIATSRVAVVSDDARVGRALVAVLGMGSVSVADSVLPCSAAEALGPYAPALLVLAADITGGPGVAALRRVHAAATSSRIVVVSGDGAGPSTAARQALIAGADAFVRDEDVSRSLVAAVRAVLAGMVCVPRDRRRVVAKPTFSHREKEVLALMTGGFTNKEIAARLYLSESTVKTHLVAAFAKLGVRSRKDAAALLLDPAEGLMATTLPAQAAATGALGHVA